MVEKFGDRVKETTSTTGTGTLDLDGAPTGFRAFSDEFTDGDAEISYLIVDDPDSPTEYEYGKGTITFGTPDTFARDTVEGSSNSGNKVSWSSGTKTIIATPTATDFAKIFAVGSWALKSAKVAAETSAAVSQVAAHDGKLINIDPSALSPAVSTYTCLAEATAGDGFVTSIRHDGASGYVDVKDDGGTLIKRLAFQGDGVSIRCDGTSWFITGEVLEPGIQTLTDAANIDWDVRLGPVAQVTLAGNRTMNAPSGIVDGEAYALFPIQDATGSRTLAYTASGYDFGTPGAPTLTTTASEFDLIPFLCRSSKLRGGTIIKGFS